uniref:C2H2-type domain-containing protein n=1 Tax=Anopheles stephensi TaxID=30069 RepID=A0A182YRN7_ANOST
AGFFPANDTTPATFLKVPNPPYIKQESVTGADQNQQHQHQYGADYGESNEAEKPLFYHRKPFEMSYLSNPYMQPHAQQYPQHALPPHFPSQTNHPHHVSHLQQQPQQPLPAPPPLTVPSDMHSPQQLGPEHMQRSQHPANFHEYYDHSDAGSALEPYAYVLQKPTAAPMLTPDTSSPLVFCYKASHKEHMFKVHFPRPKKEQKKGQPTAGDEQEGGEGADGAGATHSGGGGGGTGSGNQGRNKFKCNVCDRRFYYKRALEVHMGVHDASLDVNVLYFSCNYCPETFTEEESLQKHEAKHEADGTTDFLQNMKQLDQSENPANGQVDGGFRCPLCFKRFENQRALRDHHKTHLCSNADCAKCGPAHSDRFELAHSTYDANDDLQPTVCNICHRQLATFEQYQNHFHYHTSRVPFYCYHCREEFNDKRELYNHSRTHVPREPESYTCEVCAKVFSTKGNFKRHLKSHQAVRAFACDRCSKQYDYKSALEVHLKRSHGIEL